MQIADYPLAGVGNRIGIFRPLLGLHLAKSTVFPRLAPWATV